MTHVISPQRVCVDAAPVDIKTIGRTVLCPRLLFIATGRYAAAESTLSFAALR